MPSPTLVVIPLHEFESIENVEISIKFELEMENC